MLSGGNGIEITWYGSSEPSTVVEGGETSTPLRGSDFDDVRGGGAGQNGDTETEDETPSNELFFGHGGCDNGGTTKIGQ